MRIHTLLLFMVVLIYQESGSQPIPQVILPEHWQQGRWVETLADVQPKLKRYPVHPDRQNWLWTVSSIFIQQNRLQEAEPFLKELSTYPDAVIGARSSYWLARISLDYDQVSEALGRIPKAVEIDHDFPEREHSFLLKGYLLARLERWQEASEVFNTFLKAYPDSPNSTYAWLSVSDCDFNLKKYDQVIEALLLIQPVIIDDGQQERSLLLIAESYARQSQWKDAIIYFGQYEARFPESYQIDYIRFRLGFSLWMDNQKNRALKKLAEIPPGSWLFPFRQMMEVEVWKSAGQIDQIMNARLQAFTWLPEMNRYNLSNRLWASMKAEQWGQFETDLLLASDDPELILPVDSLYTLLAQAYLNRGNTEKASLAYQRAADLNVVRQKKAWPELQYNAALVQFLSGDWLGADAYFSDFIRKFRGHRLEGDAFIYSLRCRIETGDYDSVSVRIQKYRDRYPRFYDDIDLIQAENFFRTGNDVRGLELFEKKLRYTTVDSIRNRILYRASVWTLAAGRSDLAAGYLRVLNRFFPDYHQESVELLLIICDYQSGSFAYLRERIADYRTAHGSWADGWLVPIEVRLLALRQELTVNNLLLNLIKLRDWPSIALVLETAGGVMPPDSVASALLHPQASFLLRNNKHECTGYLAFFLGYPYDSLGTAVNFFPKADYESWQQLRAMLTNSSELPPSQAWTELNLGDIGNPLRQAVIYRIFTTGNWALWEPLRQESHILDGDINDLRQIISASDLARADTVALNILLNEGFGIPNEPDRYNFYNRLAEAARLNGNDRLKAFIELEALKLTTIAARTDKLIQSLAWYFHRNEPEVVTDAFLDEYGESIPESEIRQMFTDRFLRKIPTLSLAGVESAGKQLTERFPDDLQVQDLVFLETIKVMVKNKKRQAARNYLKVYSKNNPKSGALSEARKLVR